MGPLRSRAPPALERGSTSGFHRSRPMSGYPFNIRQVWLVVVLAKPCWCLKRNASACCGNEEILAALGYEPVGFTELAKAAQAYAVQTRFDAALISHQRGAASALDFATALHDIAPDLPIILATPSARDLDAQRLASSGIFEVVHHPLTSSELAGALSRCLPAPSAPQLQS
jgi:CheY-like chemotaxis protein